MHPVLRRVMVAACGALVAGLSACGSVPKSEIEPAPALPRPETRGLQMYWWGFDDGGDAAALSRLLREYVGNSVPLSAQQLQAWRANGLRMVSVPRSDLPALEQALHVVGAQRKSMGQLTVWAPIAVGPSWLGTQHLQMPTGELALGAGRVRLVARAWTASDVVASRNGQPGKLRFVTRVEMAAQHEERDRADRDALDSADKPRNIKDDGLLMSGTVVGFDIWPTEAIVIFPEPPDADLVSLSTSRPEPSEVATDPAGPKIERLPTAGEMLLAGAALGERPMRRAVIVLLGEPDQQPAANAATKSR